MSYDGQLRIIFRALHSLHQLQSTTLTISLPPMLAPFFLRALQCRYSDASTNLLDYAGIGDEGQ